MKEIIIYFLMVITTINSYGCATKQPFTTEATPYSYENTNAEPTTGDNETQAGETVRTITALLLVVAMVVLGVGLMTYHCCNIDFQ